MSVGEADSTSPDAPGKRSSEVVRNGKPVGDTASKHASVTELELQFAQNPDSDAYVPLCEAYLEQGRFMEAMVVCKKGIKAHPDAIDARILLARVYAEQKKYKRALQELDELVAKHASAPDVYVARAKVRLDSGETASAIVDLKKAVDLAGEHAEATRLLAAQDIVYPEPVPEPEPEPVPVAPPPVARARSAGGMSRPGQVTVTPYVAGAQVAPQPSSPPLPRGASFAPGVPPMPALPQRLEGEDELEAIARKVADERPERGKAKTTLLLVAVLIVVGVSLVGYRFFQKAKIESIDRLTTEALPLFNRDTYGGYKRAATLLEEIVEDHDKNHPLTLARLAHTYAILAGEHGESNLRPRLDEILARAEKRGPEVSHTIAARGLSILYSGKDPQEAAKAAREGVEPMVDRAREGGAPPTHADLVLGIIELQLGEYEAATKRLGHVKEVLPGSVRAEIWHARAAFRASRFGTALNSFQAALRTEPNHAGALAGLPLVLLARGDLRGAQASLERFDALVRSQPKEISTLDTALAEYARSELYRSAGEDAKANGAYETAVRLDPDNADFPFGLGRWMLDNQRAEDALGPLTKAVEMEPNRWAFLVELAEVEIKVKRLADAQKHIDAALAKAPSYVPALIAKARLLRRQESSDTEPYLIGLLEKWPSAKTDIHLELGRLYKNSNPDGAKKELELAIENMSTQPQAKQAEVLLSYGDLMEKLGERGVAANAYQKAAELGALHGWYHFAVLQSTGGRPERDEALKACDRYLGAGTSLRYSRAAQELCDSLR